MLNAFLAGPETDTQDAYLVVFQFEFVMLRVDLQRIEGRHFQPRVRLVLQFDLHDPDWMIGDIFTDMLAPRRAPSHMAGLVLDPFHFARRAGQDGHAAIEINLNAVGGMLMQGAGTV